MVAADPHGLEGQMGPLLSLGAGVQSTTLLILAARGDLEPLDGAVFADTGWEPAAVYTHLDRIERDIATPAGIPMHRICFGNIRDEPSTGRVPSIKSRSTPAQRRLGHGARPGTGERCSTSRVTPGVAA